MSFNQFSNRSQNYGNVKGSGRDQIIAQSRAKRQERQKKKKHENAAKIIQKWYKKNVAYNETINECKQQFDDKIKSILEKSQKQQQQQQESNESVLNFNNFSELLHLFKISLFGFKQNPKRWKLPKKYLSKLKKYDDDNKWFTISIRRLYSIFLRITKTSIKSQHFITKIIDSNNNHTQMIQFQFLSIILIKYLGFIKELKEQQKIIMSLWNMLDCNKWKYFDKISKSQQNQCQIFCYKLLKYIFLKTPFLSVTSSIFTQYMKLPQSNNNNNGNSKTILALLHTIIIRYFQFSKIKPIENNEEEMDIDNNDNKMSEDEEDDDDDDDDGDNDDDNDKKMDNKSIKSIKSMPGDNIEDEMESEVIGLICLEILSIPYYTERLIEYKLDSVIKSIVSDHIWNDIILQFERYCTNIYNSFVFITNNIKSSSKKSKHKKKHNIKRGQITINNDLWQKLIPSSLTVSKLVSFANNRRQKNIINDNDDNSNTMQEEKDNNNDDLDVMDIPDYDDYDDSDDDDEFDDIDNKRNALQTFMNISEEQHINDLNINNNDNKDNKDNMNTSELYINPNNKAPSLNRRKKRRNKRKRKKGRKYGGNIINELPAIVWTIHNLLKLYGDKRKFELNSYQNAKTFISFLNISQITFKLLDCITSPQFGNHIAFPYENLDCQYDDYYLALFDKWISTDILGAISNLIINESLSKDENGILSLNDYCTISKYLLEIMAHFPASKEHHIWSNLSIIPTENSNDNKNIIVLLYENVFCKYNIWQKQDWQGIIKRFFNGYSALSYFINKTRNKHRFTSNDKMNEYNSSISELEETTNNMEIFELFLLGCNHQLRVIDDEQFHRYNIPFPASIWIKFIETFKYICFISYWNHYNQLNKFQSYFKRNRKHNQKAITKTPLSPSNLLEIYSDRFDQFVSSITSVFSSLRDRNTRKAFTKDNNVWLIDKYIDLKQFEKEILNLSDAEMKNDDNNNDIDMQQQQNHNVFPQVYDNVDHFNPFSNREFGYNEMYGGIANNNNNNNYNNNEIANQSTENLRRFEDNFNIDKDDGDNIINDEYTSSDSFRRSFLILIEIPFVIPFKLRVKLFYALIELEKDQLESSGNSIRINRGNAIRARIKRDNILDDGYRGLNRYSSELKTLIQIEFENKYGEIEVGIDGGGIFKEFLNELICDAFDPERGLFLQTEYKNELYPNPNYSVFKELMNIDKDYYEFLGKMVGKALYDSVLIEPIFSQFFLRKLLSQHNYVDDLQSFDIDLYRQLMSLKHDYSNKNKIETMELSFCVTQDVLGSKRTFNLIPSGCSILVNHINRHKYINILSDYKLNKTMYLQSLSFLRGMSNVINLDYLRIFDSVELSKLLSGDTNTENNWILSWKDLRENTVYSGGFHNKHRCIKWFWEILNNDLNIKDNQKLLMFVTSCTRSPLLGFKSLNPKFSIMCTGGDTTNLPTSQTCMNLLKLPNYTNKELLKQKLLQSIRSNAGFDLS